MDSRRSKLLFGFYWKIAGLFLIILLVVSGITLFFSVKNANTFSQQVTQQLDWDLAAHTAHTVEPLLVQQDYTSAVKEIMHSMMVINPSVEVYLLDSAGTILTYVAPDKVVQLTAVNLAPVRQFLSGNTNELILGDDPRNPGEKKIFSAAAVNKYGINKGFVYIILASQEYTSQTDLLFGSYISRLSLTTIITITIVAVLIGLIAVYFLTAQWRNLIRTFQEFKGGNLGVRMGETKGELGMVAATFNEMASSLEKNIDSLKQVDTLRKELITNISHDLRTPIASIQGFTELLQAKGQSLSIDEKTEYLNIVLSNIEKLKKLVNDLFELSKLESQNVKPKMEALSLPDLVHDVAGKYQLLAKEQGVKINITLSPNLPLVNADIGLIDRALQNLIDNALKFCKKEDYINVELSQTNPTSIEIRVIDTGQGISSEDLPLIFERYYRGSNVDKRTSTGLGLAITKRIVELHGSSIEVKSKPNEGAAFSFRLPVLSL
jgi:signal transduction histidine kinase